MGGAADRGRDQPAPRPETRAELRKRVLKTQAAIEQSQTWREYWNLRDFLDQLVGRR